jgi:hypothetical protein
MLTEENEARLDRFISRLKSDITSDLQLVKSSLQVTSIGHICTKYSRKTHDSILAKACRPAIRAKNPKVGRLQAEQFANGPNGTNGSK